MRALFKTAAECASRRRHGCQRSAGHGRALAFANHSCSEHTGAGADHSLAADGDG